MTHRISLYTFKTDKSIRYIVDALTKMRYTENKPSGFMLLKVSTNTISAKHVTRIVSEREVLTPFGETQIEKNIDYFLNEFEIDGGILKVKNSSKNMSVFRSDLLRSMDHECSIAFPRLDLHELANQVSESDSESSITNLEISSTNLLTQATVKMSVSGNNDILSQVKLLFKGMEFNIKKLNINVKGKGDVEISHRGNIKINELDIDASLYQRIVMNHIEPNL
jgi:hypothetical protein